MVSEDANILGPSAVSVEAGNVFYAYAVGSTATATLEIARSSTSLSGAVTTRTVTGQSLSFARHSVELESAAGASTLAWVDDDGVLRTAGVSYSGGSLAFDDVRTVDSDVDFVFLGADDAGNRLVAAGVDGNLEGHLMNAGSWTPGPAEPIGPIASRGSAGIGFSGGRWVVAFTPSATTLRVVEPDLTGAAAPALDERAITGLYEIAMAVTDAGVIVGATRTSSTLAMHFGCN